MSALVSPFVWKEALRFSRRRPRVGWVLPRLWSYDEADASTRLRAYDLWSPLRRLSVGAELYRPFFKYDAVVFQKAFEARHRALAARLREHGVRVILDVNVDYLHDDAEFVPAHKREAMRAMLPLADVVVASSERVAQVYADAGARVRLVADSVPLARFPKAKVHAARGGVTFLYCGYAVKARELEPLRGVLTRLARRPGTRFLFVTDKDPQFGLPNSTFKRFTVAGLPELLAEGDVKLAPRDLSRAYNLGHSAAKIALPMAAGLAVAASPVPSYEGTPARLCRTESEWEHCLVELADEPALRQKLGEAGRAYVREHFDTPVIAARYAEVLREALA